MTSTMYKVAIGLPVLVVSAPAATGLAAEPRLPRLLMSAMPPAAAALDRYSEVIVKNITLGEKAFELGAVEIEGKAGRSEDNYLDRMKSNAPVSFDFISSDDIKTRGCFCGKAWFSLGAINAVVTLRSSVAWC